MVQMLQPGRTVGLIEGNAVEDFLRKVNFQVFRKAETYTTDLPTERALELLMYVNYQYIDLPIILTLKSSSIFAMPLLFIGHL